MKSGFLQSACSTGLLGECKFGEKCAFAHRFVEDQPSKRSKRSGDKSEVALLKETKNLCGIFQNVEPSRSSSILRKSSTTTKLIRCIRIATAVLRNAKFLDHDPSFNKICGGDFHQRSPNVPKFEDRSQEETEWQEQGVREAAWKQAKKILKLKEKHKATFFTLTEKRFLLFHHPKLSRRKENLWWIRRRRCT